MLADEDFEFQNRIKTTIFEWLSNECLNSKNSEEFEFKVSDLKENFKLISSKLVESCCESLLSESKIMVANTKHRSVSYKVDIVQARCTRSECKFIVQFY